MRLTDLLQRLARKPRVLRTGYSLTAYLRPRWAWGAFCLILSVRGAHRPLAPRRALRFAMESQKLARKVRSLLWEKRRLERGIIEQQREGVRLLAEQDQLSAELRDARKAGEEWKS